MIKPISKVLLALSTASLTLSPIAAQAGTRASDTSTVYSAPASQPGMERNAEGERFEGLNAFHIFLFFYVAAWTTGFLIEVTDDDDEDDIFQSPGA